MRDSHVDVYVTVYVIIHVIIHVIIFTARRKIRLRFLSFSSSEPLRKTPAVQSQRGHPAYLV